MKHGILLLVLLGFCSSACAQRTGSPSQGGPSIPTNGNPTNYDLASYPSANDKVSRSEVKWRSALNPIAYHILREAGTEAPGTGPLLNEHRTGIFVCAGCGNPLFSSATKFESGTGWPSFWAPIDSRRVVEKTDETFGMSRTEVLCARCGGHLGHVFDDGPRPTGLRYCMNSGALSFQQK